MADGQVVFEITGDDRGINTSIKKVTENIKQESRKWDDAADDAAEGASGSWGAAAAKIVGALSAAGVVSILSKWGKAAIDAASDLSARKAESGPWWMCSLTGRESIRPHREAGKAVHRHHRRHAEVSGHGR